MGKKGTADTFVAHTRWTGWIEFKGPNTKIKKEQIHFRDEMRKRGVNSYIIRLHNDLCFTFELEDDYSVYNGRTGVDIIDHLVEGPTSAKK